MISQLRSKNPYTNVDDIYKKYEYVACSTLGLIYRVHTESFIGDDFYPYIKIPFYMIDSLKSNQTNITLYKNNEKYKAFIEVMKIKPYLPHPSYEYNKISIHDCSHIILGALKLFRYVYDNYNDRFIEIENKFPDYNTIPKNLYLTGTIYIVDFITLFDYLEKISLMSVEMIKLLESTPRYNTDSE